MLKYQQIALELEKYIEDHNLQQGDKLPVLESLMHDFEVSKSTIIKALDLLEKKGYVYQVRGSGIFVRRLKRKGYISLLSNQGFKKDLEDYTMTSEVLELKIIPASINIANTLNIETHADVYYVKRVRYINDQPLCVEESYFDKDIVTYLNKEIIRESIFTYLREGLGLNIGFSDSYLFVNTLNEEEATHLQLDVGAPKLRMESIFYLANGRPFNFSMLTYNYQQSQFFIQSGYQL